MMKYGKHLPRFAVLFALTAALSVNAFAADYDFETDMDAEYYPATSYEDTYGSTFSTTQIGIMEKGLLPGLQQTVGTTISGEYGLSGGIYDFPSGSASSVKPSAPAYTSVDGMERKDGSIGTLKISSLNINMKVWEGETSTSMAKGLGHYSSTSGWDGNVGVCGHNRGAKYTIGSIKNLKAGDTITYTTIYGTRTYEVVLVKTISSSDWSYLQATTDNRITITTCLANQPSKRVCVQAVEVSP